MLDAIEAAPRRVRGRLVAVCVLGMLAMVGWPEMAVGAEFPAGCTGTTGDAGALAAAITQANTAGGANVVQLEQGCVYTLKAVDNSWYGPNGLPPIASEVTIEGNGATIARSEAQATPSFRLFFVGANPLRAETLGYTSPGGGVLTLRDVTLTGGLAKGGRTFGGGGGGAGMGGAIFSQGSVTIENSTLTANRAQGGATSTGSGGGGGIGTDATNSSGGGFGPGTFNGATGGAGGAGGGGGGAGFRSSENGVPASSSAPGAGGGPQTGLGGAGGTGAAGGDGSGGGGASSGGGLTGGLGGAFGTGGVTGGFLGSGGGGGGIGGGGGGSGMTGGGGGFGAGGGAAYDSQIGSATVRQAGGTGGFGGGGGGSYLLTGGVVGAPGFGGGTPVATNGGGGAGMGGAIFNMQGVLTIRNSTLTGNSAAGGTSNAAVTDPGKGMAGAVFNFSGTFTAVSSTIAANRADHYASQILNLVYDGAQTRNAVTTLVNSIVANGSGGAPADVASDKSTYITPAQPAGSTSVVDASRFDLLTTPVATVIAPGELGETTGSPLVADPKLGPLQDNGGPTKTMAPAPGSPVLDAGSSLGLTTDQRRDPRPIDLSATPNATGGDGADIGAFERQMVVLDNAAQSHRSWREATSRNHKRPLGTTFSYTLNQQASVQFLFMKRVRGRQVKGKCVAQTKRNRRKPACTRTITKGEISRAGHAGENKVPFRGRISPSKKLGPGDYTVIITATGVAAEPSSPQRLKFTIVR